MLGHVSNTQQLEAKGEEYIQSGCWWVGGTKALVESVRKAQSVWVLRLGVKSVMDAEGSYSLDLKSSDLCVSNIYLILIHGLCMFWGRNVTEKQH